MNNVNLIDAAQWLNDVGIKANICGNIVMVSKEHALGVVPTTDELLTELRTAVCKRLCWVPEQETLGWMTLDCY